jgi:hypothetical protein
MPFVYNDPKTGLADIGRFNLLLGRWERIMRRRLDGPLIVWWRLRLTGGQRERIEVAGYVTLILLLLALL